MLKFIHLWFVILFLGLILGSYLQFLLAPSTQNLRHYRYTLILSFCLDTLLALSFVVLFVTGTYLVSTHHFPLSTLWIQAAYGLLGLVVMLYIMNVMMKLNRFLASNKGICVALKQYKLFHLSHVLIIIFGLLIIHDAVTKSTFF